MQIPVERIIEWFRETASGTEGPKVGSKRYQESVFDEETRKKIRKWFDNRRQAERKVGPRRKKRPAQAPVVSAADARAQRAARGRGTTAKRRRRDPERRRLGPPSGRLYLLSTMALVVSTPSDGDEAPAARVRRIPATPLHVCSASASTARLGERRAVDKEALPHPRGLLRPR